MFSWNFGILVIDGLQAYIYFYTDFNGYITRMEIELPVGLPKNKGVQIWIIIQIDKRLVFWKGKFTASAEELRSHLGIWRFRVDISEFRSVISEFRSVISESIEILKIGTLSLKVRIRTQVTRHDPLTADCCHNPLDLVYVTDFVHVVSRCNPLIDHY